MGSSTSTKVKHQDPLTIMIKDLTKHEISAMAKRYEDIADYKKAEVCYLYVIDRWDDNNIKWKLANYYYNLDRYTEALAYYKKCRFRNDLLDEHHTQNFVYARIGWIYFFGKGVKKNLLLSRKYFTNSCKEYSIFVEGRYLIYNKFIGSANIAPHYYLAMIDIELGYLLNGLSRLIAVFKSKHLIKRENLTAYNNHFVRIILEHSIDMIQLLPIISRSCKLIGCSCDASTVELLAYRIIYTVAMYLLKDNIPQCICNVVCNYLIEEK